MKIFKFRAKNALFEFFWAGIWKSHCNIGYKHPWVSLKTNFRAKVEILKFRIKNVLFVIFGLKIENAIVIFENSALFRYFRAGPLENYCHFWNQQPQIFLKRRLITKIKILKSRTQNALFWVFSGWNLKRVLSDLKSALSNFSKMKVTCKNGNP